METVTTGRAKRATAGNRMKELLLKAQQEDEDDLFKEVEDDQDFTAPQDVRDVFLDEFADTDDEVEVDEEEEERRLRKEERKQAKTKGRPIHNPLASRSKPNLSTSSAPGPSTAPTPVATLASGIDPTNMAPSTFILALRKERREAKRLHRSENRRSNLRASTLAVANQVDLPKDETKDESRKGRKAQHEGGEVRGVRPLTQDELIAGALEEEERNKEALRDWLKKEQERRELRRVGRKRVRGPRWTWVSRTVGRLVEEVQVPQMGEVVSGVDGYARDEPIEDTPMNGDSLDVLPYAPPVITAPGAAQSGNSGPSFTTETIQPGSTDLMSGTIAPTAALDGIGQPSVTSRLPDTTIQPTVTALTSTPSADPSLGPALTVGPVLGVPTSAPNVIATVSTVTATTTSAGNVVASTANSTVPATATAPVTTAPLTSTAPATTTPTAPSTDTTTNAPYTRNYLILSQIPGGLPAELKLILGDHVEWDQVKYIPARLRPINRKPVLCPFTGLRARYRHPTTMIPYANVEGYKRINEMMEGRYVWWNGGGGGGGAGGAWMGEEGEEGAEGVESVDGWLESVGVRSEVGGGGVVEGEGEGGDDEGGEEGDEGEGDGEGGEEGEEGEEGDVKPDVSGKGKGKGESAVTVKGKGKGKPKGKSKSKGKGSSKGKIKGKGRASMVMEGVDSRNVGATPIEPERAISSGEAGKRKRERESMGGDGGKEVGLDVDKSASASVKKAKRGKV